MQDENVFFMFFKMSHFLFFIHVEILGNFLFCFFHFFFLPILSLFRHRAPKLYHAVIISNTGMLIVVFLWKLLWNNMLESLESKYLFFGSSLQVI